ncbi:ABC transporter, ATP-binding protein [Mycolicibacterium canariasense]|uniref:ABC transporter, ATP-binding protein n=1 Tax=Mycolicibacterium canariasense TaxID=228230 RepID=A0A117IC13_MYCCR|nr:hypothetical protein [Mycolicibacterium canariasense]MCV7210185.1 hypothetical protein [Mycolicibacterium canariasense]ORV14586.1 hypothetical protein AWB94_04290 [Mycolicibacterium canariasense]GAS98840.1 ABC transporter, ATP-binding protein [Mycolicibacterium canariasense]
MTAAEVLAQHAICSCGEWAEDLVEHSQHQLDALRAAGYAVIELPENAGDWHVNDVGTVGVYLGESGVHHRGVSIRDVGLDLVTSAAEARVFAAALLAAADAAEADR